MRLTLAPALQLARLLAGGFATTALAVLLTIASPAAAQLGGGGGGGFGGGGAGGGGGGLGGGGGGLGGGGGGGGLGGGGGGGGLGGGGGGGGGVTGSGVVVDADGVLRRNVVSDPGGRLAQQRIAEALNRLPGDLTQSSQLRKVSLTRLEAALAARLEAGEQPTDPMQKLAGLTRVDYVFCYPETQEIVLAGPAEPWGIAPSGRVQGLRTGSPTLELQDLVTALRAFRPETAGDSPTIYCSIDPTEEGLARMRRFLSQVGLPNPNRIASQLQQQLGHQIVTVGGVPADTHFAQVLVEADYRMKLIGIGLENPPAPIDSYVALAKPASIKRNAMQRWFFVPEYERLKASEDGLAMEMIGEGVRLIGEDEMVTRDGGRRRTGSNNRASQKFVTKFTEQYSVLAAASPVYAQLRNCIDLAVTAAFMRDRGFYEKTGWKMPVFGDETKYAVRTHNAPTRVNSAVNAVWKGSTLVTPIGGGVKIEATEALASERIAPDDDGTLAGQRDAIQQAAGSNWWWD